MKKLPILLFIFTFYNSVTQISADNLSLNTNITVSGISGVVVDKASQDPLPYVTIVVESPDGTIVTGGITDDYGNFSISKINVGNYLIKIQFIGYKTHQQKISIEKSNQSINLGTIELEENISSLDEVVIVAEQSTMVQRIDRRVVNVGRDLTTAGATAGEIMNNIPSVNVDQDGNISLRGNSNVKILVDGKPTNIDAAQLLRQIPSSSIKQIELITNPSAKYNPEGMSGIINIILHKNTNDGFNGDVSVNLTKGDFARFNSSINLNYRTGKLNFYGNYGAFAGKRTNAGELQIGDNPHTPIFDPSTQSFDILSNSKSHLLKAGMDYYLNDKNTLSFYTTQTFFNHKMKVENAVDYGALGFIGQNSNNMYENINAVYNFAYKHKINEQGHEISFEADYNNYENDGTSDYFYTNNAGDNYSDFVWDKRENTTLNLDYVNPLTETMKLEAGLEVRLQNTDNDFEVTSPLIDDSEFYYNRSIYSAYVTFGNTIDKWSYQAGVRAESYNVDAAFSNESNPEIPFTDEVFSLYPSAFLSYAINDNNALQLSYSRRVDRPGLNQVNPIREFSTPTLTSIGNQNLKPQFTNSMELNYTFQFGKGSINAGVFYRLIQDEISRTIVVDELDTSKLIQTYDNFDDNQAYGFEFSGTLRPASWWNINGSFDLYAQNLKGVVDTERIEVENVGYTFRLNNSFKATKNLTFQAFGMYRSSGSTVQFDYSDFYFVNAGMRYTLLQGDMTVSFNVNDIFDTQRSDITATKPYPMEGTFRWDSQTWQVGLSYKFGGVNNRAMSRKQRDRRETNGGGGFF